MRTYDLTEAAALHPESSNVLDYQAADARWFARHPSRRYRFRKPYVGEPFAPTGVSVQSIPPGWFASVIVVQIKPGVRIRARLVHSEMPTSTLSNNDAWIAGAFEACCPVAFDKMQEIARHGAARGDEDE